MLILGKGNCILIRKFIQDQCFLDEKQDDHYEPKIVRTSGVLKID
jgi:hypothetical protein